ncbi:MAG: P1 family peptidase [Anaerolineaceae bacterium]|nr:P1 family peptidase [Anaerolineaceae bacterium]
MNGTITDVPGIKVGHAQNFDAITGCTVVLFEKGAVAGVDQRGGAPGTRETDAIRPKHLVSKAHAIMLAGGSAYGLDTASGAMKYLEEHGIGFDTGVAKVPIVPSAILYDLALGSATIRPDAAMGYEACLNATNQAVPQGCVGAGTGAVAGTALGINQATKSGIGSASMDLGGGLIVGALIAVNPFGDVIDPKNGHILAGARTLKKGPITICKEGVFADTLELLRSAIGKAAMTFASSKNTVIGVVATNAAFDREQTNFLAQMAQDGLATTIRPSHTLFDGDTLFALSTGKIKVDVNVVGAFAALVVAQAILNAVVNANSIANLPSYKDLLSV